MDRSDEKKFIEDIESRYRYSETEEGLIIRRLLEMYKDLDDKALRDQLTGLYNRKAISYYIK